jgi:hypothetical protein
MKIQKYCSAKKGSFTDVRDKEAYATKIESALKMFWYAISQGLKVDYVFMDSWFICGAFIIAVKRVKKQTVHLIGCTRLQKQNLTIWVISLHIAKSATNWEKTSAVENSICTAKKPWYLIIISKSKCTLTAMEQMANGVFLLQRTPD